MSAERRESIDWAMLDGIRVCHGECKGAYGLPSVSGARQQWPAEYDGQRCQDCGQWAYRMDQRTEAANA